MDPEWLETLRRRSGLRLTADGTLLYRGAPLENPRVRDLFLRGLAVREDGAVTLRVGGQWCYVEAEGVARFASALRVEGGRLVARFTDGTEEVCASPRLGFAPDGRCYLWPSPDAPPAVLGRAAHQSLGERLACDDRERPVLPLDPGSAEAVPVEAVPVEAVPVEAVPVEEIPRAPGPATPWEEACRPDAGGRRPRPGG